MERALARVDLGAIERNCARLRRSLADGAELCVVVKAGGYGHGAAPAARAARNGGAAWIAVATAGEAAELRESGIEGRLLVMGALTTDEVTPLKGLDVDVVAWSDAFLDRLDGGRVHVKYDTGMGRLGTADPDEARALVERVAQDDLFELAGLMTHFATADEPGDDHFPAQLERFRPLAEHVRAEYPGAVVHAANSAATLRDPAAHFDMVRCGIAAYGLDPFQRDPAERDLEPALALESYVASVKRFEPGDSAGYGRTWTTSEPTDVAVLPIGYGDGWRRSLSNNARVLIGGRSRPLVGTVSMDNVTVDLGTGSGVSVGDPAVLIGAQGGERILAEEVARAIGTINYEVTCGLTARVRREHA